MHSTMPHIKLLTFCLLVYLILFLNMERILILFGLSVSINSFVYFLGILMMLAIILDSKSKKNIWFYQTICLSVYTISTLFLLSSEVMLPEVSLVSYLTEIFILFVLVLLTSQFSCALGEFEQVMEDFLLSHVLSDVKSLAEKQEDIQDEICRCRRNNHPFQLIIVEPKSESYRAVETPISKEMLTFFADRYESNKVGSFLHDILRRTDILAEQVDKKRFILLCPARTSLEPDALPRRIKNLAWKQLNLNVACGVANFPDDSLTLEELITKAELQLVDGVTTQKLLNHNKVGDTVTG